MSETSCSCEPIPSRIRYWVELLPHAQIRIHFPDFPEVILEARHIDEAIDQIHDALVRAIQAKLQNQKPIQISPKIGVGESHFLLPLSTQLKILFILEARACKLYPAELARRMNISRQEALRIFTLTHPTKVNTLQQAFYVMGRDLSIQTTAHHQRIEYP